MLLNLSIRRGTIGMYRQINDTTSAAENKIG